ncbi:sn-glycerol-1-phosphate dehydrogenase [Paenibacillus polymyxa]|uniref:sn-glycerol-1-phosphate dehydrogenase n=1 Tax=Paenibacillus polymyxa TaxID=1406 RepID=UPI0020248AC7|nr:sn-glycerol-1-phosphate dehydrogenase [Paenibacillus polymyxa]MDU8675404.1 sn-glycerol-1-phosphate dehydrogenase [Paenibacillus polymyxa]MDU8700311.1 sn-glycerol-1-phosphate dehydrogenase [Paenibacillus polymyxa]MEE4578957.1 sn-glycerol-1-phosphate dehydrogenase [Paenibacillus polymyxa]URJ54928.1 sn-glycerol-1-phosphate dehydrogenase [Paenibacillus polymyxa]URJ66770.1 sn-glycerol-1-phosphate dehydrogenase [Paenibacillus polymyxa]
MNMNEQIKLWNEEAQASNTDHPHRKVELFIEVRDGALESIASYLNQQNYKHVTLVEDEHTSAAAGKKVAELIREAGLTVDVVRLPPNAVGDAIADETYIMKVLLGVADQSQAVLAVGSGTIHDLVRFVCYKMNRPFLSVPTAASVDGFTSAGAPLIVDGSKQTFQAVPPEAIFADLSVLASAPQVMTAAGFGDMLGKFTSLADWHVSRDLGNEPYSPVANRITEEALRACVEHVDEIAAASKAGVEVLMNALIASGISMLMIDHSRPASGGEHHISHRIEMDFIAEGRKQVLHGAKVGVASALLSDMYRELAATQDVEAFEVYRTLPTSEQMRAWLAQVGGPSTIAELGVTQEQLARALRTAHTLRDRYTGLKYMNEHQLLRS